jgi:hypothetical protein
MTRALQGHSYLVTMRHQWKTFAAAVAPSLTERGHGGRARGAYRGQNHRPGRDRHRRRHRGRKDPRWHPVAHQFRRRLVRASPAQSAPPSLAPIATANPTPCSTRACITSDAETLKGTVAKDNAVMTKVARKSSTVTQVVPGTYTVRCTAAYSDGAEWRDIANVLTSREEVGWEPIAAISYGSS